MRTERGARLFPALAAVAALAACEGAAHDASAFCRTLTCPMPPDFSPQEGACTPPDFDAWCAKQNPPAKQLPVYWSNACISYDIQQDASVQVPYATASQLFAQAFDKWTNTECPDGRVSIQVADWGPVECDQVQYSSDQGNQHVIIFHDQSWPYDDSSNTLGLTTITYDPDTGELYDADMEINSTPQIKLSLGDPVPSDGYDLQSIIQHETGHFFGLAHTGDSHATMFAHYIPGTSTMRALTADDTDGICSIYLPSGERSVADGGTVEEGPCNATPRHGFQSSCAQPKSGCDVSFAGAGPAGAGGFASVVAAALILRRRRARTSRM